MRRLFYGPKSARVLIIGEAPSKALVGREHLAVMRKDLAKMADVKFPMEWSRLFARTNVLPFWPGREEGKEGDLFPLEEARIEAAKIFSCFDRFGMVVILGKRAARSFDMAFDVSFHLIQFIGNTMVTTSPHPSGISRWWNDPKNAEEGTRFWEKVGAFAKGGAMHIEGGRLA